MPMTKALVAVFLAASMAAGSTISALAVDNTTGAGMPKPAVGLSPDSATPLTQNECLALGGETSNLKSCVTGMMCTTKTVDSKGVVTEHQQCVTKAE